MLSVHVADLRPSAVMPLEFPGLSICKLMTGYFKDAIIFIGWFYIL